MHLDLGFALLILGVLSLLAFSPWFRRFALVCVALLVVAVGVGVGIVHMKINRENEQAEQAMAHKCLAPPAPAPAPRNGYYPPPGVDLSDGCDKWLAEHPQAKD